MADASLIYDAADICRDDDEVAALRLGIARQPSYSPRDVSRRFDGSRRHAANGRATMDIYDAMLFIRQ